MMHFCLVRRSTASHSGTKRAIWERASRRERRGWEG